jgi:hypothetical protein
MPVDQPRELRGDLVALAQGRGEREREPLGRVAGDLAFDAPDVLEIDDDPFADSPPHRGEERYPAGRHVCGLAGILLSVRQHVAAEERHTDAMMPPPLDRSGACSDEGGGLQGHGPVVTRGGPIGRGPTLGGRS